MRLKQFIQRVFASVSMAAVCMATMMCMGCGQSASTAPTGGAGAAPAATGAPATAAAPAAPKLEGKDHSFGDYTFRLPERFNEVEVPAGGPPNIKNGVWKAMLDETNTSGVFTTVSILDPKEAVKSTGNMRQTLVNFSAGATDRMGIKIGEREPTETMSVNGLNITFFGWNGVFQQVQMGGVVYGFVEGDRVICMLHISFDQNVEKAKEELKRYVATWKHKA